MKKKILLIPLALLLAMSLVATGCPAPAPGGITVPSGFTKLPLIEHEYEGITMTQYMGSGTAADATSSFKAAFQAVGWTFMSEGVAAAGYTGAGFEKGNEIAVIYAIQVGNQVTVMVIVAPKPEEVKEVGDNLEDLVGTTWRGNISGQFSGEYAWFTVIDNVEWSWEVEVEITADAYIDKLYLRGLGIARFSRLESVRVKTLEPYTVENTWYSDVSPREWPFEMHAYLYRETDGSLSIEWGGRGESMVVYSWFVEVNHATTPPFDPEWVTEEDKIGYYHFHVAPPATRLPGSTPAPVRIPGWLSVPPMAEVTMEDNVMHIRYDGPLVNLDLVEIGHLRYEGTFTKVTGTD